MKLRTGMAVVSAVASLALVATGCSADSTGNNSAANRGAQDDDAAASSSPGDNVVVGLQFTNSTGDPLSLTYLAEADGKTGKLENKDGHFSEESKNQAGILVVNPSQNFKQSWILTNGDKEYKFNWDELLAQRADSCTNVDKVKSLPKVSNEVIKVDFVNGGTFNSTYPSPIGYWGTMTYPNGDSCVFKMDRKFWRPDGEWLRALAGVGIVVGMIAVAAFAAYAAPVVTEVAEVGEVANVVRTSAQNPLYYPDGTSALEDAADTFGKLFFK